MTLSTVGQSLSGFWDALSGTLHTVFTDPGTANGCSWRSLISCSSCCPFWPF